MTAGRAAGYPEDEKEFVRDLLARLRTAVVRSGRDG